MAGPVWDTGALTWDRGDLFWDLPSNYLLISHLFGPDTPVSHTTDLDLDFQDLAVAFSAHGPGALSFPYTFTNAGLNTPAARLDANFFTAMDWARTWALTPLIIPYTFASAMKRDPLNRLDANFAEAATWHNTHLI